MGELPRRKHTTFMLFPLLYLSQLIINVCSLQTNISVTSVLNKLTISCISFNVYNKCYHMFAVDHEWFVAYFIMHFNWQEMLPVTGWPQSSVHTSRYRSAGPGCVPHQADLPSPFDRVFHSSQDDVVSCGPVAEDVRYQGVVTGWLGPWTEQGTDD